MTISVVCPIHTTYVVTQKFGENPQDYQKFGFAAHPGKDLADPSGTPIYPAAPGKVTAVLYEPGGYGNYIILNHGLFQTLYAHMAEKALVQVGMVVDTSTMIGRVGSSGNSTGPHLHFEIIVPGAEKNSYKGRVDPDLYLQVEPTTQEQAVPVVQGQPKYIAQVVGVAGVRVRNEPSTANDKSIVTTLPAGLVVGVYSEKQDGVNTWACLGVGLYCAKLYDGYQYLQPVK